MSASRTLLIVTPLLAAALGGCLSDDGGVASTGDTGAADAAPGDTSAPEDTLAPTDTAPLADTSIPADVPPDVGDDAAQPAGTCAARCGVYVGTASCQCDAACTQFDNCCADYAALCSTGPAATDFLVAKETECAQDSDWIAVTRVRDGDTLELATGDAVRFLVMDTPEISSDDCQAWEARAFTAAEVEASGSVCLVKDPTAEDRDLYDRLLRYVYVRDPLADGAAINLNVRLVRLGYARVYYPYAYGRLYEPEAKTAQAAAKAEQLGGWGSCGW